MGGYLAHRGGGSAYNGGHSLGGAMTRAGRSTQSWYKVRRQCWQRDKQAGNPCHICGQAIDYNAKPSTTPDSWEPDHIISVKSHPELAELPENVAASHKSCNRSKKDKAGINELGRCSRRW